MASLNVKNTLLSTPSTSGQKKKSYDAISRHLMPELSQRSKHRRHFLFDADALHSGASFNHLFRPDQDKPYEDFNDIVDQDEQRVQVFISQELVGKLIDSMPFKIFIIVLIIVNCILIGLQTNPRLSEEYRLQFNLFDQTVLAIFTCEILLKWYYGFWIFWKDSWNTLDFAILAALLIGPQLTFLSSSRVLRILRVVRAFRSLRGVGALRGLHMVVQATLQSIPDMANICLLLLILVLVFGVMGVSLFGMYVPEDFGDLQSAMYSMFVCVTEDGWVDLLRKFQEKGTSLNIIGSLYLFVAVLVGAFVFANLVVAVVVTNLEMEMRKVKEEDSVENEKTFKDDRKKLEVIYLNNFQQKVDFTKQTPMEKVSLKHLNVKKLEKYFLVISALEDNLAEYVKLKEDLTRLYDVVRNLNVIGDNDNNDDEEDEEETIEVTDHTQQSDFLSNVLNTGDILSNMMQLEEQGVLTVNSNAHTVTDVIRTTSHLSRRYRRQSYGFERYNPM